MTCFLCVLYKFTYLTFIFEDKRIALLIVEKLKLLKFASTPFE